MTSLECAGSFQATRGFRQEGPFESGVSRANRGGRDKAVDMYIVTYYSFTFVYVFPVYTLLDIRRYIYIYTYTPACTVQRPCPLHGLGV